MQTRNENAKDCESLVPQNQVKRMEAEIRLLEQVGSGAERKCRTGHVFTNQTLRPSRQALLYYHKEMGEARARNEDYPEAKSEEMWGLQRELTDLKRSLKKLQRRQSDGACANAHFLFSSPPLMPTCLSNRRRGGV